MFFYRSSLELCALRPVAECRNGVASPSHCADRSFGAASGCASNETDTVRVPAVGETAAISTVGTAFRRSVSTSEELSLKARSTVPISTSPNGICTSVKMVSQGQSGLSIPSDPQPSSSVHVLDAELPCSDCCPRHLDSPMELAHVQFKVSVCHLELKEPESALHMLESIEPSKRNLRMNIELAKLSEAAGKHQQAASVYRQVLDRNPMVWLRSVL